MIQDCTAHQFSFADQLGVSQLACRVNRLVQAFVSEHGRTPNEIRLGCRSAVVSPTLTIPNGSVLIGMRVSIDLFEPDGLKVALTS